MGIERNLSIKAEDIVHMVVNQAERSADFTLDPDHRSLIEQASRLALTAGLKISSEPEITASSEAIYDTPIQGLPKTLINQKPGVQLVLPVFKPFKGEI